MERVSAQVSSQTDFGEQLLLSRALLWVRKDDLPSAMRDMAALRKSEPTSAIAFEARRRLHEGLVLTLESKPNARTTIRTGLSLAEHQGALLWVWYGLTLLALADRASNPSDALLSRAREAPVVLSMLAEAVLLRLDELSPTAFDAVLVEATGRPWRWRQATRRALASANLGLQRSAAHLLEAIGEQDDVERLRDLGRSIRDRDIGWLGLRLARRLAPRVLVQDLGRVRINVGARAIDGSAIRRKVLALLCLLIARPRFACTREEVIDSLWPELDPPAALNSLNQTVYFLRRVFEPEFRDETSPGYVGQDGETIWLDAELIDSQSRRCADLIRSMPADPTPDGALDLAMQYEGRFALDFAYEDWALTYRESLHASYLRVMERSIGIDLNTGHFGRGIFLAERTTQVDPEAEEIQAALVRLYRYSGAHLAAAHQYEHYARSLRDLGIDPPALADV
jgi:DNA-binding SARP family transcriptional activator